MSVTTVLPVRRPFTMFQTFKIEVKFFETVAPICLGIIGVIVFFTWFLPVLYEIYEQKNF